MMSSVGPSSPEFEFWEYVNCSRCQLPFSSDSGSTVPFWLTECGHVICNSHLNADQSCPQCGTPGIQLIPLQKEMDAPMSEWFRSIPYSLDAVAYAAKFQQESMATQIRYYKSRHHQQRKFIEKLRHENAELKQANAMLMQQDQNVPSQRYRREMVQQEPTNFTNNNGKRSMMEPRPFTSSSPRSSITPMGPNRLTIPPGQPAPNLFTNQLQERPQAQRPGSSQLQQKFTYIPPSTGQGKTIQRFQRQDSHQTPSMNPKFRAARVDSSSGRAPSDPSAQHRKQMGPPPPPQRVRKMNNSDNSAPQLHSNAPTPSKQTMNANRRFLPPEQRFSAPGTSTGNRFIPPTPSRNANANDIPTTSYGMPGSRAPSRASMPSNMDPMERSSGGQRMPFVPRGSGSGNFG